MTDLSPTDLSVLETLLKAQGQAVDISTLLNAAGNDNDVIDAALTKLETLGCRLHRTQAEAQLIGTALNVWSDYLTHKLNEVLPRTVEVYQKTASTQDLARSRANQPVLFLADEQTGGRGRLGRRWLAPPGTGLLFSLTHRVPADQPGPIDRISFITAVAVAQAIESITDTKLIQVRWPNDIYVGHQKLAGILVETVSLAAEKAVAAVIGIGINVGLTHEHTQGLPPELRKRITSFAMQGWHADRLLIAEKVVTQIDKHLRSPDIPTLIDEWRTRNLFREQPIQLTHKGQTIHGTVIDLDPDQGLILRRDTGEIIHLPAATTSVVAPT